MLVTYICINQAICFLWNSLEATRSKNMFWWYLHTHSMFGLMVLFCDALWLIVGTNNFQGVLSITLLNVTFYFVCFQRHCQYLKAKDQAVTEESYTNSLNSVLIRLLFIQPLHSNNSPWGIPLNWLLMCVFKRANAE